MTSLLSQSNIHIPQSDSESINIDYWCICLEQSNHIKNVYLPYHILKLCDNKNEIIDYNIPSTIVEYYENDLLNKNIIKKILSENRNYKIIFSMNKIIQELLFAYAVEKKNVKFCYQIKTNILKQLSYDFHRMDIRINFIKILTLEHFLESLSKYKKYYYHIVSNIFNLILILCTQSSFFYLYNTIFTIYYLPEYNIHIISDVDYPTINIIENQSSLNITIKKNFNYINIDTGEKISQFYTYMDFFIDLQEYIQCSNPILYWVNTKNVLMI